MFPSGYNLLAAAWADLILLGTQVAEKIAVTN